MDKIEELIQKGQTFNFANNSYRTSHGTYSKATDDLLAWAATVEDFIRNNFGEESGAFKLYQTFDRQKLTGYEQYDFDRQLPIIIGALKACKTISPKAKNKQIDDHQIIQLIKNIYFWSVLLVVSGSAFALGLHFGSTKFDKEKSEYYETTKSQEIELNDFKKETKNKDLAIIILNKRITSLQDSLTKTK